MEHLSADEGLSDDTVDGALARRRALLGAEELDCRQTARVLASRLVVGMTEAHAIDKSTALALYRSRFPGEQGLNVAISSAVDAIKLENGLIVYRLPNGDWVEPQNSHYVPASFPWAQLLERNYQSYLAEQRKKEEAGAAVSVQEQTGMPQTGSVAQAIGKVLGSAR
jgi:hypothetical protein